jgi:tRNA(His) guanylyltransferase
MAVGGEVMATVIERPLDERMREHEENDSSATRTYMRETPIIVRLDGSNFRRFTHNLAKPYDMRFSGAMIITARHLATTTNALVTHTHSDEISLLLANESPKSEHFMGGRRDKIISLLASRATWHMTKLTRTLNVVGPPIFDARAFWAFDDWATPARYFRRAFDYFAWREWCAERNSVHGLAMRHFSHKQLQGKNRNAMRKMLRDKGVVWEDKLPHNHRYGTFFVRGHTERKFTAEEIEKLPPLHDARKNPNLVVRRQTLWAIGNARWKNIRAELEAGRRDFSAPRWVVPEYLVPESDIR